MPFKEIIYAAWIIGTALQVALAVVLIRKKAWRIFPFFMAYTMFCLFQSLLAFALRGVPHWYLYAYWTGEIVSMVLGLSVIYEVFTRVLANYRALHKVASGAFQVALTVLVLSGAGVVYFHAPVEGNRWVAGLVVVEQAARIIEVGLIVFLFSFSRVFGLHWRQWLFALALGLGLFTTVELVGVTLRAYFGPAVSPALNLVRVFSFNCSLLVWIGYLVVPERVTTAAELPRTAQLEQWNQAILELIHQ
jgi:hypothetical protein